MNIVEIIEVHGLHFLQELKAELNGDKDALYIIEKYLKGDGITNTEEHILKVQLFDSLKIVGIGVPFVLIPGASILMPILIKVAKEHNIELLPSTFINTGKPT